jgi:predicted lipoprotein with Yx(FWY)xxD motif
MSVTGRRAALALALAAAGGVIAAAPGLARDTRTTVVKAAHNARQNKQIVVNARGMTLYLLTGDAPRHLKCTHRLVGGLDCLTIWKPLTVRTSSTSRIKAGPGVTGRLGLVKRAKNSYQVTLRGIPLYTYVGDSRRGDVNGEGIRSFGGTWHTLPASTRSPSTKPPTTTMPPTTSYPPSTTFPY